MGISELREKAKELLEKKEVSLIIGYEEKNGGVSPCFIKDSNDVERLVFNEKCFNNLAVYLTRIKEKVGIVAKGCDIKSIIGLLQENQIKREDIIIIGVICGGMEEEMRIADCGMRNESKEGLQIADCRLQIAEKRLLQKCRSCDVKNPQFYDILIGEKIEEEQPENKFSKIIEFEKKSSKERWDYLKKEMEKCIRCYACRQICPFCYCERCIVDVNIPQWISGANSLSNNMLFHITRALHLAGRCVGCGECERACPMGIKISLLNLKLAKDVEELFGYIPGRSFEIKPPLQEFKIEDYNEFIG